MVSNALLHISQNLRAEDFTHSIYGKYTKLHNWQGQPSLRSQPTQITFLSKQVGLPFSIKCKDSPGDNHLPSECLKEQISPSQSLVMCSSFGWMGSKKKKNNKQLAGITHIQRERVQCQERHGSRRSEKWNLWNVGSLGATGYEHNLETARGEKELKFFSECI